MTPQDVTEYLAEHEQAWSPNTARSTKYTLLGLLELLDGDAKKLWDHMEKSQAPYTRVTSWARVVKFWDWCQEKGKLHEKSAGNPYSRFRQRNARSFKYTYTRRPAAFTFGDAKARCERITDPSVRKKALELLQTGMRWTESTTLKNGVVVGKGGKVREILSMPHIEGPKYEGSYSTFVRHLKNVGLKPHDLRKVFADNLVKKAGFHEFDLCETMGWESLETARSYVSSTHRDRRRSKILEAINGKNE